MDNEFILQDRIQKIQQIIRKYGEENFYISYSGGKDSNVLSKLIDMALPDNRIPRVYCNTGIEYRAIVDFVKAKAEADDRFIIIQPKVPIKRMLEEKGYPFKSKEHSRYVGEFQKNPTLKAWKHYYDGTLWKKFSSRNCPDMLKYQFTKDFTLKVSDKCCHALKQEPLERFAKESHKEYRIIGLMASEGGRRNSAKCLSMKNGELSAFQPLVPLTKSWEDWFISKYKIDLPILYYPPYNFLRTGCKGCPFNPKLQQDLDTLRQYFPAEAKQCEYIWKPVYDEYRRLGYRLRKVDENQISFFD
jgi:3'-phosphoadenosine 5'-phosphosulfate sulfotransferase (PAPS reductase)/FAD synthetase